MPDEVYGVFSTSECQRIWKAVGAFERLNPSLLAPKDYIGQTPIYFRNDSGEVIPPYSIVQLTDTVDDEGKIYYLANKPIASANSLNDRFVVSGSDEIAINGYSAAQEGPIYRIKTTGSPAIGTRLGPDHNAWTATTGIMFSHLGDDLIESGVVRADSNESLVLGIATSGIPSRIGTTLGSGSVAVRYVSIAGANRTIANASYNITAYNLASDAVAVGAYVLLARVGAFPIVIWEEC